MMRALPALIALLLLPSLALAQDRLRSGPNAPALSAQPPPTSLPREGGDPSGALPARPADDPPRTAPPEEHRTLEAPPVPGAQRPEASEGFGTNRERIPPDIGERIRPGGSTTGR
jgi:hypothetical protein